MLFLLVLLLDNRMCTPMHLESKDYLIWDYCIQGCFVLRKRLELNRFYYKNIYEIHVLFCSEQAEALGKSLASSYSSRFLIVLLALNLGCVCSFVSIINGLASIYLVVA